MKKVFDIVVLVIIAFFTFEVKADMEAVEETERKATFMESVKEKVSAVKRPGPPSKQQNHKPKDY